MKQLSQATFFQHTPPNCESFTNPTSTLRMNAKSKSPSLIISEFEDFTNQIDNTNKQLHTINVGKLNRVRFNNQIPTFQQSASYQFQTLF